MVAVIKVSNSIGRILNYNENKVKQQKAVCLTGRNFPGDATMLGFNSKLNYFSRRMELNANTSRNSLHISLNFDPSEKNLPPEKLSAISAAYMEGLGFEKQPYLVYQHFDAGHPHLHLVTTNIRADGSRIDLHHLAIRKSEPARKKIEKDFTLVVAQDKKRPQLATEKPGTAPAVYGKVETRGAIQNVLETVLDRYRYTSLGELNAVLGIYNVTAQRGKEGSMAEKHKGLYYRILDRQGLPVGVPVKASLFYSRPTLTRLESKFARNSIAGKTGMARIKNAIDLIAAGKGKPGLEGLGQALSKDGITMVKRQNEDGFLYGLTYVDHKTGAVFNGSTMGKAYSAKAMQQRFTAEAGRQSQPQGSQLEKIAEYHQPGDPGHAAAIREIAGLLESLTAPQLGNDYVSKQFTRKNKRRKRGNL